MVRCYRNLHKDCYSIVSTKTGRVDRHQRHVVIANASFRVRPAGRERVLKTKRKNVHAFVCGLMLQTNFRFPDFAPREAYYNPYKTKTFVDKETKKPIERAQLVVLLPKKILYWENQDES